MELPLEIYEQNREFFVVCRSCPEDTTRWRLTVGWTYPEAAGDGLHDSDFWQDGRTIDMAVSHIMIEHLGRIRNPAMTDKDGNHT
jgi:hypothetical protein